MASAVSWRSTSSALEMACCPAAVVVAGTRVVPRAADSATNPASTKTGGPPSDGSNVTIPLAQATRTALAEQAYQQFLIDGCFEPDVDSNSDKFRRLLEEDVARWTPIVKALGLKID